MVNTVNTGAPGCGTTQVLSPTGSMVSAPSLLQQLLHSLVLSLWVWLLRKVRIPRRLYHLQSSKSSGVLLCKLLQIILVS